MMLARIVFIYKSTMVLSIPIVQMACLLILQVYSHLVPSMEALRHGMGRSMRLASGNVY